MKKALAGIDRGLLLDNDTSLDPVAADLTRKFPGFCPDEGWGRVTEKYPVRATPHYLDLVREPTLNDPVFRQIAPSLEELDETGDEDAVNENEFMAVPGLLHRYPDRALILATTKCFVRCRHCMRKRMWNKEKEFDSSMIGQWRRHLEKHPEINEVILSGGDPLCLSDSILKQLLSGIFEAPGVMKIRVHTRAVVVKPSRITPELARLLATYKVKKVITQFNHPIEITRESLIAVQNFLKSGIQTMNQNVLLMGVNDDPQILAELFSKLAESKITPYYLHHPDPTRGAMHFHLSLSRGQEIFKRALALIEAGHGPEYVIDRPGFAAKTKIRDCFFTNDNL